MSTDREAVLALNARYLEEFVEAYNFCPFAKRCRASGRLAREVFAGSEIAPIAEWVRALAPTSAEVALAILPNFTGSERALHAFCAQARAAAGDMFYAVAFHPDAALDAGTPERLVPFLRKSPHATLQFVRAALLDEVRGGDVGSQFAPSMDAARALAPQPRVSDAIAEANLATVRREGPDKLAAQLAALRDDSLSR